MWQIVINGPGYFDTAYELPEGLTYVGRADNNDIVLSGDQVSRRHVKIEVAAGALTVQDMGSRNGTKLNGQRVEGPFKVKVGDTVGVGENSLAVRQPTAAEAARTEHISGEELDKELGQVLVSREREDNPFVTSIDKASALSPSEFARSMRSRSPETA
jgi:pSer/pThr/pTyr-binding forkhead associated (FHA) protein